MVASTHWLASAAGMRLLEAGGNAFDAAAAAGFVLQVVEPHLNGPGGDLPIVLYSAERDEVVVVCGQGPAPAAATSGGSASSASTSSRERACLPPACPARSTPGSGCCSSSAPLRFATCSNRRSAMRARVTRSCRALPRAIASLESMFRSDWPTSAETWLPAPAPWSLFRRPALADTYSRLLDGAEAASPDRDGQIQAARDAWYRGFVAEAIGAFCERTEVLDTSGRAHTRAAHRRRPRRVRGDVEAPESLSYEGWTVYKTGPWGQGPVLLQQLALLDGFDLASLGAGSAEFVHTVVECAKLAFADREAWYGDPAFATSPSTCCSPPPTRPSAARSSRTPPRPSCVPAAVGRRPAAGDPR